jgi:predicted phage terminase large subunit-like protein
MKASGVGGTFTGLGGNWILIDDPIKNREDADSLAFREALFKWYNSSMRTRLEKGGSILITMTRWHEDDLAGRLLKQSKEDSTADQWEVLHLPAIKENELNPLDTRKLGEALWPEKFDVNELKSTKGSIGTREWSALYQQSPVTEGGNLVQEKWIKFYTSRPHQFDQIIQSWDFAVKDKATSDFTVGQVWGKIGTDKYLLDQVRGRFDFPTACQKVIELSAKYPDCRKKLIEAKANGPAIIQMLRNKVSGLVEVEPRGDKVARMHAVSPEFESGHVYLPDKSICSWIGDYLTELKSFPTGVNDDQVDATTQALDNLVALDRTIQPRVRFL